MGVRLSLDRPPALAATPATDFDRAQDPDDDPQAAGEDGHQGVDQVVGARSLRENGGVAALAKPTGLIRSHRTLPFLGLVWGAD